MRSLGGWAGLMLLLAAPAFPEDACSAVSSTSDVRFTLGLKDHRAAFEYGEIIPVVLSFTATTKDRYWADVRNYDRSGRLGIEWYCVEPEAPDPLASYFRVQGILGGGLGSTHALDATPFHAEAELNEWRSFAPGHYRVYAVSSRVWRVPDPGEQSPYGHVSESIRSNAIEFEVKPANPEWQVGELRSALQNLGAPASPDAARHAARQLRFLNTKESTRQLAKHFYSLNEEQPVGWDLMFGLYGSPYRQLAIETMRAEIAVPGHAITNEFLQALVHLQVSADPDYDPAAASTEDGEAFWARVQAHTQDLMRAEVQATAAALPRKTGRARALTLLGLLFAGGRSLTDTGLLGTIRAGLAAAWPDLPRTTQENLLLYQWPLIAGPEMLPVLRRLTARPLAPATEEFAMRNAALQHLFELDPAAGREAILKDLENPRAQPPLEVIALLSKEEITPLLSAVLQRVRTGDTRTLDYQLVERYADETALGVVQAAFANREKWACAPQAAMLRYFLRVGPEYGVTEVRASLAARKDTGCYQSLLQDLGDAIPNVEKVAIEALDDSDPEVVRQAALALGRWGSAEAEPALWRRLERFHDEWAGRREELRSVPDYRSPEALAVMVEQDLLMAIATGRGWMCPPEKLRQLGSLVLARGATQDIETWTGQWQQGAPLVSPVSSFEGPPTFMVLQYSGLTEDQLCSKLAQFPRGTQLRWQFWQPDKMSSPISLEKQDAVYERVREAASQHGIVLHKYNHP